MRGLRALAWLACLGASAGQLLTIPPPRAAKQDAVDAQAPGLTAREAAADMIRSRLATQTTRPAFEQGFVGPRRVTRVVCVTFDDPCDFLGGGACSV